jgi:SAM-dependent methyltransferase
MKFHDAVSLIDHPDITSNDNTTWADLGCGNGLFSIALASLLRSSSTVYAIDKIPGIKDSITEEGVKIKTRKNDFTEDELDLPPLDGILMANSLHFVHDKFSFVNKISEKLKSAGRFIIVEYNSDLSNRWVPYPLPFTAVSTLFNKAGFYRIDMISKIPSVYRDTDIYGCIITR